MASLYEIDAAILGCIDAETGEVLDFDKLEALQLEREQKIESVALWYKNLLSDAEAYKAEKQAFADREAAARQKADSLKIWLSSALAGSKMTTPKVAISFRKSRAVEIEDEATFIEHAQRAGLDDLLSYKTPTISKTAVKAALEAGREVTGAAIVEKFNIQIK